MCENQKCSDQLSYLRNMKIKMCLIFLCTQCFYGMKVISIQIP